MDVEITRSKKPWGLLVLLLLLVAGGGFLAWRHMKEAEKSKASAGAQMPPVVVTAETLKVQDLPLPLEYVGQTAGLKQVEVRARVGGILLRRCYVEGRPVRKGDLLFVIDPAPYKAELDQARGTLQQQKVQLDRAKIEYDRVTALFEKKALSEKDRDDAVASYNGARAAVEAASAAVRQAQINLGYTQVRAPESGITSKETRSEGNLITLDAQGSLLTTIVQVNPLYVDFAIPADEARRNDLLASEGKLKLPPQGLEVRIALGDGSVFPRGGKVNFQDRQVDPATGSIKARAEFPNPDGQMLPGQFVRVQLQGGALQNVILVPQRSVLQTQQGNLVYVLDEKNVPHTRPVVLSDPIGDVQVVEKGLAAGERIVLDGVVKVQPDVPVLVTSGDAPQS